MLNKKAISLLMILGMLFSTTIGFAQGQNISDYEIQKERLLSTINMSEEIDNALNGISDKLISENIQVKIDTIFIPENQYHRNSINIDPSDMFDTGYTVKKVGDIICENGDIDTMYALTAFAKEKESNNSSSEAGVDTYITIVWIDTFGTNNEFIRVKGHWSPNGQVISDRYVGYGKNGAYEYHRKPTQNAFNYSVNESGLSFHAVANAEVSGYGRVGVSVDTSMFE